MYPSSQSPHRGESPRRWSPDWHTPRVGTTDEFMGIFWSQKLYGQRTGSSCRFSVTAATKRSKHTCQSIKYGLQRDIGECDVALTTKWEASHQESAVGWGVGTRRMWFSSSVHTWPIVAIQDNCLRETLCILRTGRALQEESACRRYGVRGEAHQLR